MKTKYAKTKHVIDLVHSLIPFGIRRMSIFFVLTVVKTKNISSAEFPKRDYPRPRVHSWYVCFQFTSFFSERQSADILRNFSSSKFQIKNLWVGGLKEGQ